MAHKSGGFRIGSRSLAQPDALGLSGKPQGVQGEYPACRDGAPLGGRALRSLEDFAAVADAVHLSAAALLGSLFHGFRCTGGTSEFAAEVAHEILPVTRRSGRDDPGSNESQVTISEMGRDSHTRYWLKPRLGKPAQAG